MIHPLFLHSSMGAHAVFVFDEAPICSPLSVEHTIKLIKIVLSIYYLVMVFCHVQIRVAYSYTIGTYIGWIVTSCALQRGYLSRCLTGNPVRQSDVEILGSGHVRLYPLDIFTTHPCRALGFAACGSLHGELSSCIYHGRTRLVPAQDRLFALILWYVAKTIY